MVGFAAGDASRPTPSPAGALGGRSPRCVSIICLPGAGGPALADAVRDLSGDGALLRVRLVVAAVVVERVPMLIGDPLSGVFWPHGPAERDAGEELAACADAERRARQLWWFLWELGVDAHCAVVEGRAAEAMRLEVERHRPDVLVLAGSSRRPWRCTLRALARHANAAAGAPRIVWDRPPGRFERWMAG